MGDANILQPRPVGESGQQAQASNLSGGKGIPKESDGVKIFETRFEGGRLVVTVEGSSAERVMSTDAKNLAYAQRFEYGMTNAGIEPIAGIYVPDEERYAAEKETRAPTIWRRDFRLTPGI